MQSLKPRCERARRINPRPLSIPTDLWQHVSDADEDVRAPCELPTQADPMRATRATPLKNPRHLFINTDPWQHVADADEDVRAPCELPTQADPMRATRASPLRIAQPESGGRFTARPARSGRVRPIWPNWLPSNQDQDAAASKGFSESDCDRGRLRGETPQNKKPEAHNPRPLEDWGDCVMGSLRGVTPRNN